MDLLIKGMEMSEPEALAVCVQRVLNFYSDNPGVTPEIHCRPRSAQGWCEYLLRLPYRGGGELWVGAIQRTEGAEWEFHS